MKVFISWSGEKSKEIASVFKEWVPAVIQAAKPYFSPNDVDKGARWSNEIAAELESSRIGLICLTDDNLQAPWLMFEAGALSKSMEKARVCPMLFGVEPTDLAGPLVQFQAAPFSKEEVHKVIKTINAQLGDQALEISVIDSVFAKWWPELDEKIQKILAKERKKSGSELRSDRDLLEEVLKISRTLYVRDQEQPRSRIERGMPMRSIAELIDRQVDLASEMMKIATDSQSLGIVLDHCSRSIQLLIRFMPEELQRRSFSQLDSVINNLTNRIKELQEQEDLPF